MIVQMYLCLLWYFNTVYYVVPPSFFLPLAVDALPLLYNCAVLKTRLNDFSTKDHSDDQWFCYSDYSANPIVHNGLKKQVHL